MGTDRNRKDSKSSSQEAGTRRFLPLTCSTKFSSANIFFLESAINVVPPIPMPFYAYKLDTVLISHATVRLLAPQTLFFYIPLSVFPFRAVRPTVVVKISTMLIQCGMFCCEFLPPASFLYCIVASNPHTINLRNVCFNTFLEIFNEC